MSTHNRRPSKASSNPFTSRPHTVFGGHSISSLFTKSSNSKLTDLQEEGEVGYSRKNSSSSSKTVDVIRHIDRTFSSGKSSTGSFTFLNQSQESLGSNPSQTEEETFSGVCSSPQNSSDPSILKEGYLNKKVDLAPGAVTNTLTRGWKLYYVTLKGAKLSFYKPPSEAEIRSSLAFNSSSLGSSSPLSSSPSGPLFNMGASSSSCNGMPLIPATFNSEARVLLFEPQSNEKGAISEQYVYGDMFTEVDVLYFKFKRYVGLLLFKDCIMVFKRRWIRNNRSSIIGAVNGALRLGGHGVNTGHEVDPSKGYFTKWKHHATYPLSSCEVMDASSTLFSQKASGQAHLFSQSNSSASSIATLTPQSDFSAPLASGKVQAFQLFINDKQKTTRLFVAPHAEAKIGWTSRFSSCKDPLTFSTTTPLVPSDGNGCDASTSGTIDSKPDSASLTNDFPAPATEATRSRLYWGLGQHPELVLHPNFDQDSYGEGSIVKSGTVNALIHEAIFSTRTSHPDSQFRETFLHTYSHFTSSKFILQEIKRYVSLFPAQEADASPGQKTMKVKIAEFVAAWLSLSGPVINTELLNQINELVSTQLSNIKLRVNLLMIVDKAKETRLKQQEFVPIVDQQPSPDTCDAVCNAVCNEAPPTLLKTGLTPSVFLKLDVTKFAQQLYSFHYAMYGQHQPKLADPCHMLNSLTEPIHLFSCTPSHPHFLTKLIYHHLFFATASTSPTRRAALISQWIQVGHMSRDLGDMTSWLAIAQAICSPPVVRLSETWRNVDRRLIKLVNRRWGPVISDTALYSPDHPGRPNPPKCMVILQEPNSKRTTANFSIPFFGPFRQYITRLLHASNASNGSDSVEGSVPFENYWDAFQNAYALRSQWPHALSGEAFKNSTCPFVAQKVYVSYFERIANPHLQDQSTFVDEMKLDFSKETLHSRSIICETYFVDDYVTNFDHNHPHIPLNFPHPLKSTPLYLDLIANHYPLKLTQPCPDNFSTNGQSADSSLYVRKRTQSAPASALVSSLRDGKRTPLLHNGNSSATGNRLDPVFQNRYIFVKNKSLVLFQMDSDHFKDDAYQEPTVQICSGKIDELVEVLLFGIVPISKTFLDYRDMPLPPSPYHFNLEEFREIFFCTYRSFSTPKALFELLKENFNRSLSLILSASKNSSSNASQSIQEQLQILEVFRFWITFHFHDFLDLPDLRQLLFAFFYSLSHKMVNILSDSVRATAKHLYALCEARSLSPVVNPGGNRSNSDRTEPFFRSPYAQLNSPVGSVENLSSLTASVVSSWDINKYSEVQLLEAFHHFVVPMLRKATAKDYFLSSSLLEAQSISPASWLSPDRPHSEEETVISDVFSLLENCRRRTLILNSNSQSNTLSNSCERHLVGLLPRPMTDLWQFRDKIRRWAIHNMVAEIELDERVKRILKILRMIVICRRQMALTAPLHYQRLSELHGFSDQSSFQVPFPSFVERGLISGILSPESRCFIRAWTEVSSILQVGSDDLNVLLDAVEHRFEDSLPSLDTIAPCVGWVFESAGGLIHLISDQAGLGSDGLNFSKRVGLYKLLQVFAEWVGIASASQINRRGYDTFNLIADMELLQKPEWTRVRNIATNENGSGPTHYASSIYYYATGSSRRVFGHLVSDQLERQKSENRERERLMREARAHQLDMLKKQQEQAKRNDKQLRELQQRRAKSKELAKVAGLFRAVQGPGELALNLSQLSSIAHRKPVHTIKLINATAQTEATYTKREFVLRIITEEGGQFLLQCLDALDMESWATLISKAARQAAARRVTLLAQDVRGSIPAEEPNASIVTCKHRNSVFGVDLSRTMQDGRLPTVALKCIAEVESRGIEEVGIYRVPGSASKISALCRAFDANSDAVDLSAEDWQDVNVVACTLKQFLRDLPEPIATYELYDEFIQAVGIEDYDERLFAIKDTLPKLPANNYVFLKALIEHLEKVTDYEEVNHMYATNLAIVFGPTIFRPPPGNGGFALSMANLGLQQNLVKHLILQYHWLFDVEAEDTREDNESDIVLSPAMDCPTLESPDFSPTSQNLSFR